MSITMRVALFLLVYFAVVHGRSSWRFKEHVDELIKKSVELNAVKKEEENPDLFEGDILIDEDTKNYLFGREIMSRDAVISPIYYWPGGVVFFTFDEKLEPLTIDVIREGINHLKRRTCIKFVEISGKNPAKENYVKFISGEGCYSRIGRDPLGGEQEISIGYGCVRAGTVVHEIMHALGFFHEHTRPDRDKYIHIDWKNILKEHKHNFKKYPRDVGSSFGKPYDYDSVMHYSRLAFSKDWKTPTIVPKDTTAAIGQRMGLSLHDREEINNLYQCKEDCVDKTDPFRCMELKSRGACSHLSEDQDKMIQLCPNTCGFCAMSEVVAPSEGQATVENASILRDRSAVTEKKSGFYYLK